MPSLVATTSASAHTTFVRTHYARTNSQINFMELTLTGGAGGKVLGLLNVYDLLTVWIPTISFLFV